MRRCRRGPRSRSARTLARHPALGLGTADPHSHSPEAEGLHLVRGGHSHADLLLEVTEAVALLLKSGVDAARPGVRLLDGCALGEVGRDVGGGGLDRPASIRYRRRRTTTGMPGLVARRSAMSAGSSSRVTRIMSTVGLTPTFSASARNAALPSSRRRRANRSLASRRTEGPGRTKTPRPCRATVRPADSRTWSADRTVMRATPWCSVSCDSDGSRSPGPSLPLSISSRRWAAI